MNKIHNLQTIDLTNIVAPKELHYPLLDPILSTDIHGQGFINHAQTSCFIIGQNGWSYQLGDKNDKDFNDKIFNYIERNIGTLKEILWFGYPHIEHKTEKLGIDLSYRYEFEYIGINPLKIEKHKKYPIQEGAENHLKQLYKDHQDISTYWNNLDNFIKKSFAYIALDGEDIIAYALSASHVHSRVELDIWTHEAYRGQGISKMLCHHFINHCKKNNLLPKWDCAEDNTASINLANHLGFTVKSKYPLAYMYELKNTK